MDSVALKMLCDSSSESDVSSGLTEEFLDLTSSTASDFEVEEHAKIENFFETIEKYSDWDFKSHFRVNRTTALHLIDRYQLSTFHTKMDHGGQCRVSANKSVYMLLWYMANSNTFREVGNLFGISKSSAWRVIKRTVKWVMSIGHEYVKWPNATKAVEIMAKFEKIKNIPNVFGCIDCSHIQIKAPRDSKEAYFNREHFYSLHLQGTVDADKKFIDIFVGEPGSLHDSRVLIRRSSLYERATNSLEETFPNNSFLLGDSAYPSLIWMVGPIRDNGSLTAAQRKFNYIHSSTRITVEDAFGLLKTRFRRLLHFTEQTDIQAVTNLIVCGCILHNICCIENDDFSIDETVMERFSNEIYQDGIQRDPNENENRRDQLFQHLITNHILST